VRVLVWGGCWPTNIGNGFVDLGVDVFVRAALGEQGRVWQSGGLSPYLFGVHGCPERDLPMGRWIDVDYLVMGGMTQCVDHFRANEPTLRRFIERGARVIVAGGGACDYDAAEVAAVREFMESIPIHAFVSRDTYSYEAYGDLAERAYDGIDSAFFVTDHPSIYPLSVDEFVVSNFDNLPEPRIVNASNLEAKQTARVGAEQPGMLMSRLRRAGGAVVHGRRPQPAADSSNDAVGGAIDAEGRLLMRTHHALIPHRDRDFADPYTLMSDLPWDYLSLYARAHTTYSDRIHACIATLAFGNRAQLFGRDVPRLRMFERLGAGDIMKRPVSIDAQRLQSEKQRQVEFLREVLLG
jgi:hypothetical protein